ncbi:MAG: sulfatase-like hydrolase/transferase [Roseitalea porphyridii]|uniref:sulfatase-like hydrolase/transferase n=1 Tax=Roseitalea porphyridii TaxID=1852022 RepID=UPI0032D997C3
MSVADKQRSRTQGLWMGAVALTAVGLGLVAQGLLAISLTTASIGVAVVVMLASFLAPTEPNRLPLRFLPPLVLLPVVLFAFWYFMTMAFGHFGIGPILFHMEYGTRANGVVGAFLQQWIFELGSCVLLIAGVWMIAAVDHRFRKFDRVLVAPLLLLNPFTFATLEYVGDAQAASEQLIQRRFVDTAELPAPGGKRPNLINVFLESSEATLGEGSGFGDVLAPLAPFAARGIELGNLHEAALTNWTLAGQVAAHCGTPLMPLGLVSTNSFHVLDRSFLPAATCLADLLSRDGYRTTFMKAAPLGFAGTDKFVASHGWQNRLGFPELRPDFPLGGNEWGLDDEDVYAAAEREIARMDRSGEPWAISVTNIGGHAPRGFVSRSCRGRPTVARLADPTLRAFRCTHELLAEMLTRLEQGGYLDDTIVVVQSDHLAMRNTIYRQLQNHERRNLFFAFGPGIEPQVVEREMTMMDVYPTLLDLMGYAPAHGRAGVGVSAFAEGQTLVEEHGLDGLDRAIYADTELRNRLWAIGPDV